MAQAQRQAHHPREERATGTMGFLEHLDELRARIVRSCLAIGAGMAGALLFYDQLGEFVLQPTLRSLPPGSDLIFTRPSEMFAFYFNVALIGGVILASPFVSYQVWRFIAPGLTAVERRAVLPWIPAALVFFAIGVGIAYAILPYAVTFLLSFLQVGVTPLINIRSYFDFVSGLFLAFGILMEFPILLVGLSRVGIVTSERLRRSRRLVILGTLIFATVATPGGDLVSPTVLWLTLLILFEFTVFFIRRTGR